MNFNPNLTKAIAILSVSATFGAALPSTANAQSHAEKRRSQKQDEWKKIGIGSAAAGVLGLITKNGTLTFLGAGGALYSAYRYEQDRKSKNRITRERAQMYSRPVVWQNGKKYVRKTSYKNGKKYYSFVRA